MNKFVFSSLMVGTVFGSGLVSCSKEIKTQDIYLAPTPKIVREAEAADINSWDHRSQKELDLQDAFDVSASRPARLEIESNCNVGTSFIKTKYLQEGASPIRIYQVVPEDYFLKEKLDNVCSFTMRLFNAAGSERIFKMNPSQIVERRVGKVRLDPETSDFKSPLMRYVLKSKQKFHVRFNNETPTQARVICTNIKTDALSFQSVIELSAFEYQLGANVHPRQIETCRVILYQDQNRIAISPLFQIQPYAFRPLKIDVIRNYKTGEFKPHEAPLGFQSILEVRKVMLDDVHITNLDPVQRVIKLVDNRTSATASLTINNALGAQRPTFHFIKNGLVLLPPEFYPHNDFFVINPGETLKLKLVLLTEPLGCRIQPVNLQLKPQEPFVLQDLGANREVIATNEVKIPEWQWTQSLNPQMGPAATTACKWPDQQR